MGEYLDDEANSEVETRDCHNFACHTTHWGQWGEWGKCGKAKNKNTEKWQKRRRVCMYNGAPLSEWQKIPGVKTKEEFALDQLDMTFVICQQWSRLCQLIIKVS